MVALICALPVLMFLQGTIYQAVFISFMVVAVLMLLRTMRATPSSDLRQQIRWALFGFTGYALFRALSIGSDFLKWSTDSFGNQLLVEMLAGVALALTVLVLQLGLLIALLRYRLYDAEAIISKTASIAIVTVLLGAGFAGVMEGIITNMQNIYPDSQTPAAMIGAMVAVMMIEPLHRKVNAWAEKRFHKNMLELKHGLPEAMRDLRDVTSFEDFIYLIAICLIIALACCTSTDNRVPPSTIATSDNSGAIPATLMPQEVAPTLAPITDPESNPTFESTPIGIGGLWLQIISPQDDAIVNTSHVDVIGSAPVGVVISINDEIVIVGNDQQFKAAVALDEGPNLIEIVASDEAGGETSLIIAITYEP